MSPSSVKVGERLRWHDPDDGLCDCEGVVVRFGGWYGDGLMVVLKRDDGTDLEAPACELEPVENEKGV